MQPPCASSQVRQLLAVFGGACRLLTRVARSYRAQPGHPEVETERANIKALFDHVPSFFCILAGPEYRFEYVNPAHQRVFLGRDCTGLTIREAIPEADREITPIL